MFFVGYSPTQKGHKCYHPPSRKWFVSMDITFLESHSYFLDPQLSLQGEKKCVEEIIVPVLPTLIEVEPTKERGEEREPKKRR